MNRKINICIKHEVFCCSDFALIEKNNPANNKKNIRYTFGYHTILLTSSFFVLTVDFTKM